MGSCASIDTNEISTLQQQPQQQDPQPPQLLAAEEEGLPTAANGRPSNGSFHSSPGLRPSPPRQSRVTTIHHRQQLSLQTVNEDDDSLTVSGASLPLHRVQQQQQSSSTPNASALSRRNSAPAATSVLVAFTSSFARPLVPLPQSDRFPISDALAGATQQQQQHPFSQSSSTTRSANSSTSSSTRSTLRRNATSRAPRPVPPPLALSHFTAAAAGATVATDDTGKPIMLLSTHLSTSAPSTNSALLVNSPSRPSPSSSSPQQQQHYHQQRSPTTTRQRATVANPFRQPPPVLDDELSSSSNSGQQSQQQMILSAAAGATTNEHGALCTATTTINTNNEMRTHSSLDASPHDFIVAYNASANSEDIPSPPGNGGGRQVDVLGGSTTSGTTTSGGSGIWSSSLSSPPDGLPHSPVRTYVAGVLGNSAPATHRTSLQSNGSVGRLSAARQNNPSHLLQQHNNNNASSFSSVDSPRTVQQQGRSFAPLAAHNSGDAPLTSSLRGSTSAVVQIADVAYRSVRSNSLGASSLVPQSLITPPSTPPSHHFQVIASSLSAGNGDGGGGGTSLLMAAVIPSPEASPLYLMGDDNNAGASSPRYEETSSDVRCAVPPSSLTQVTADLVSMTEVTQNNIVGMVSSSGGSNIFSNNPADRNNIGNNIGNSLRRGTSSGEWWSPTNPPSSAVLPPPSRDALTGGGEDDMFPLKSTTTRQEGQPHQHAGVPSLAELAGMTGNDASNSDFAQLHLNSNSTDSRLGDDDGNNNNALPHPFSMDGSHNKSLNTDRLHVFDSSSVLSTPNTKSPQAPPQLQLAQASPVRAAQQQRKLQQVDVGVVGEPSSLASSPISLLPADPRNPTGIFVASPLATTTTTTTPTTGIARSATGGALPAPVITYPHHQQQQQQQQQMMATSFSSATALPYSSDAAAFFESGDWEAVPVVVVAKYKDQIAKPRSDLGALNLSPAVQALF